jgi:phage terminase large subunit GpA-like protein
MVEITDTEINTDIYFCVYDPSPYKISHARLQWLIINAVKQKAKCWLRFRAAAMFYNKPVMRYRCSAAHRYAAEAI